MITVVGSFNMDLFIEVPRFPAPGETLFGKNFRRATGGKGANQACALARLGESAAIIGAVGQDAFGDEMLQNLAAFGVDTTGVVRRTDTASGTAVVTLDARGENQIIVANGANDTLSAADVTRQLPLIKNSRALITQLETPLESVEAALRAARESGIPAILNPAPHTPVPDAILGLCDWLIPNEIEAAKISNLEITDTHSAARAVVHIRKRTGCANILVTLGPNGAWLDTPKFAGHIPGFKVTAVDTVGAGDTFIGGFVTQLLEHGDAHTAARFGCAAAAIAVTRRGAQASLPTKKEVTAFLENNS
ncbi:MAG TPA: ribokinase [Verrucomicrobiae bacterium]|jgi:ribokinase|nr:ribokinase [Verrucomicrobiae bacterium]